MDNERVIVLLEKAADHLARMLVEIELGVEMDIFLPGKLKPDWVNFQDAIRQLLAIQFETPPSWVGLAFSRVPVPSADSEVNKDNVDVMLAIQESEHNLKIDYKSWSLVYSEILAEIERIKAISGTSKREPMAQPVENTNDRWPEVDMELNQVRFKGKCYRISREATLLMDALVKAKGEYIAANAVTTKPSRVYESLQEELKEIIERSNKGYRIKLQS